MEMSTTSDDPRKYEENPQTVAQTTTAYNTTALAAHPYNLQVEKEDKSADTLSDSRERRRPKVTFSIRDVYSSGEINFAKMYLPKTYKDAKDAAVSCFENILKYPPHHEKKGTLRDFELKALIKKHDAIGLAWAWAHIRPDEWWEIMNDLIQEDPHLEVGIFPHKHE